ncbi:MAG: hypothetical protein V4714_16130 [Bacteroidota bacterium]
MKLFYSIPLICIEVWVCADTFDKKYKNTFLAKATTSITIPVTPPTCDLPEGIRYGHTVFSFSDITQAEYTKHPFVNPTENIIKQVAPETDNYESMYKPVEQYLIEQENLPFNRVNNCWVIKLSSGKTTQLCDKSGKQAVDDYTGYKLIYYHSPVHFYQFSVSYYEEGENMLVNAETGEEFNVWNYAYLSPDHQRFIVCSYDLDAGFSPNGIQMWKVSGDKLVKEFELELPDWGPADPVWVNGKEVYFKRIVPDRENGTEVVRYTKLSIR